MSDFVIQFARPARKDLEALPEKTQDRILEAIDDLRKNPHPRGSKKLKGSEDAYRIRVGDYRVVYEVYNKRLIVFEIRVRHRKDAYQ